MKRVKKEKTKQSKQKTIPKTNKKVKRNSIIQKFFLSLKGEGWFYISMLLISTGLFLFFGLSHLGKQIYTDEPVLWYPWIEEFGYALKSLDFSTIKKPYNYPGLPVIALGSLLTVGKTFSAIPAEQFHEYLFLMKSPIVVFNFLTLFIIYFFSKKLWNKDTALLTIVLIALHPLIIAFSQHTQGDTTLWNTFFISLLSYFIYLKSGKIKYILITAFFFALAVLSKFTGMLLYPLFFIFLYGEYLFVKLSRKDFVKRAKGLLGIYLILPVFVFILYPLAWSAPILSLKSTYLHYTISRINPIFPIAAILLYAEVAFLKGRFSEKLKRLPLLKISFVLSIVLFLLSTVFGILSSKFSVLQGGGQSVFGGVHVKDYLSTTSQISRSLNAVLPWYIFGGLAAIIIKRLVSKSKAQYTRFVVYFLFSALVFSLGAVLGGYQVWVKYALFLIPMFAAAFALLFTNAFPKSKFLLPVFIVLAVVEVISVYPTYFSYRNRFLPLQNSNQYDGNYGGYELAQKANALPGSDTLKILSDTYGFMYFFRGQNSVIAQQITEQQLMQFDYVFLSSFGKREKTAWGMIPYSLRLLYEMPIDSAKFKIGSLKYYAKLVDVSKLENKISPENYYDPDFYVDLSENNSICFWIKSLPDSSSEIISLSRTADDNIKFLLSGNTLSTQFDGTNILSSEIVPSKWQHICWISKNKEKGNQRELYINGKKTDSKFVKNLGLDIKGIFMNMKFKGEIQDFRIYNKPLTNSQRQAIYNEGEIITEAKLKADGLAFAPVRHYTKQ
ncbi:MAG: glycosyltransferase family 39 protein [Bacteroidota bacterium]|nr:glycosyltransferase family 39 protein [Bacteroidota bacterium]